MKSMIDRLAAHWGLAPEEATDVLQRLDAVRWAGGEGLDCITHAGTIDTGHSDMMHGHNGYWIADATTGNVCSVTNGDAVWDDWTEDTAIEIGEMWGDMAEMLTGSKI